MRLSVPIAEVTAETFSGTGAAAAVRALATSSACRGSVAPPRADVHAGPFDAHLDPVELPVRLAVGRVVAEEVIRRQVVRDALHPPVEVVAAHHGHTVGVGGQHAHVVLTRLEHPVVGRERGRRRGSDRRVEDREAARIHGVEGHVPAIRVVD